MQVYVQAKSKKEINERLAAGETVYAEEYSLAGARTIPLKDCPEGTAVKIFDKYVQGNPYAKAYGTWSPKKGKVA